MLLVLSIVALLNVVLLTVTCCMLYFLMKKRVQAATTVPCTRSADAEKGTILVPVEQCAATYLAQSNYSSGSLNSAELLNLPHNLCPSPKRTPFGGTRKPISLNETFASSMSSLSHSLSGLAILNAQLDALKNQRNNLNETFTSSSRSSLGLNLEDLGNRCSNSKEQAEDDDSGYGSSGHSTLDQALDEVLNLYNNLEALKYAQQNQPSRPRSTKSLSLPRLTQTLTRHPSSTGITLDPYCLDMEF